MTTAQPMVKALALLTRKPEISREEFIRHWVDIHAPMAHNIPAVKRYVLNFIIDEPTRSDMPTMSLAAPVDGIAEIWFENEPAYRAFRASDQAKEWLADGATFISTGKSFLVVEQVIIE